MNFPSDRWRTIGFSLFLFFLFSYPGLQAQQRPDIYTFSPTERLELRNLMMTYITTPVVNQHLMPDPVIGNFHNYREEFLTWHREYIADLEAYLLTQAGGDKFVPLPKWNPITVIPDEFFNDLASPGVSSVAPGWVFSTLTNQDPADVSFVSLFNNLCSFMPSAGRTAIDNFAQDLEGRHDSVHGNIGGIMGSFQSPAAAIFWLWHAWVDDVYRQYECDCQSIDANDLYSKDSVEDVGYEANDETTGIFYNSVDIWVRNDQDVVLPNGRYAQEDNPLRHQNPEYRTTTPNYVYVKIRNRGCNTVAAGTADLRVYWSKASTGLNWPTHFNNYMIGAVLHGDEITVAAPVAIPALDPGETYVAEIPWFPPNPADFTFDNQHFCLLSRIVSTADPMTFTEGPSVYTNTRNNNNIAWKNLTVVDLDPFNLVAEGFTELAPFFVRQTLDFAAPMKLVFRSPDPRLTEGLQLELEDKFLEVVRQGDQLQGVDFFEDQNGNPFLRMTEDVAEIGNLLLPPGELFAMQLNFTLRCEEGDTCLQYGDRLEMTVEQYYEGDFADEFVGGNLYEIRIQRDEMSNCNDQPAIDYVVSNADCANFSNGAVALKIEGEGPFSIFWSSGQTGQEIEGLLPGTYQVIVRDAKNCIQADTVEVGDDSDLKLVFESTPTTRRCDQLGSVKLTVTGGQPDYRVQWSTGSNDFTLEGLETGMYYVTVTDAAQCQRVDSISVNENFPIRTNTVMVENASGANASDGSISLLATGGAKPLAYAWSNGETGNEISGLPAGDYELTITDQLGCTLLDTVTVDIMSALREPAQVGYFSVVPNPARDRITLHLQDLPGSPKLEQLLIFSADGRLVRQVMVNRFAPTLQINISELPSGMYSLLLKTDEQLFSERFVKE